MKEIVEFLKQRQNVKYSVWIIIFGLIFAFSFQANRIQILKKPVRVVFSNEEAKQYQVSGWQGAYAKGKESILKIAFPEKKAYRLVLKAFSCSPPDVRDQRIEVHFNNVALDKLKFRKTSEWQEFCVDIPYYLPRETNIIKFVYTQDTRLSPVAFESLEVRNYIFRINGLYLLSGFPPPKIEEKPPLFIKLFFSQRLFPETTFSFKVLGYSFGFVLFFWLFWLFYSCFLFRLIGGPAGEAGHKMQFSRAARIDFLSYLPSIILISLLTLISFFSPYHFVCSFKTFFVFALAPTAVLKLFPYKDLFLRFVKIIFRCVKISYREAKRAFSFLKKQPGIVKKFFIRYHKTNLSSAFILDFMILLVLCAFLLMIKESIATWIADRIASLAYFLLVAGVIMKIVQCRKKGDNG